MGQLASVHPEMGVYGVLKREILRQGAVITACPLAQDTCPRPEFSFLDGH